MLLVVQKFLRIGSVTTQQKGCNGFPVTVTTNKNQEQLFDQVLQSPQ